MVPIQACSAGDASRVHSLLERHCPPDSADYDNRTGLMLASVKGHVDIAQTLLKYGANPERKDNFGSTAYSEATKNGHDAIITLLKASGTAL